MEINLYIFDFFFFFSSRRRHTRFDCDWSSDVCSSDLARSYFFETLKKYDLACAMVSGVPGGITSGLNRKEHHDAIVKRSEERRVGKECRSRRSTNQLQKKIQHIEIQASIIERGRHICN